VDVFCGVACEGGGLALRGLGGGGSRRGEEERGGRGRGNGRKGKKIDSHLLRRGFRCHGKS